MDIKTQIIFLPGLGAPSSLYKNLLYLLASKFEVKYFDWWKLGDNIDLVIKKINNAAKKVNSKQGKTLLVAHSGGASICLRAATIDPMIFSKIVLLDSHPGGIQFTVCPTLKSLLNELLKQPMDINSKYGKIVADAYSKSDEKAICSSLRNVIKWYQTTDIKSVITNLKNNNISIINVISTEKSTYEMIKKPEESESVKIWKNSGAEIIFLPNSAHFFPITPEGAIFAYQIIAS